MTHPVARLSGALLALFVVACVTDTPDAPPLIIGQDSAIEILDPVPNLIEEGDEAFFRGDFRKAADLFAQAHRIALSRSEASPDNVLAQIDIALTLDPMGRVAHAQGDAAEARARWTEMAALAERALEGRSNDPNLRFLSGLAHMRLASLGEADMQAELAKGVASLEGLDAEGRLGEREQQMLSLAVGALAEGAPGPDGDPFIELDKHDDDTPFRAGDYRGALEASTSRLLAANAFHLSGALGAAETASVTGSHAWRALFAREFTVAEASAQRGLELDPSQIWIATNLAHALMFQDRIEEADAIYLANKGVMLSEEPPLTWEAVIADDFAQLRAAGIDHPHMDDVLQLLAD